MARMARMARPMTGTIIMFAIFVGCVLITAFLDL
jgi:hypothetical protein